jgi:hypothetical protein
MFAVVFGFAGPAVALASPAASADPSDSPTPDPTPTPSPSASSLSTCDEVLTFSNNPSGPLAFGPNQGIANGVSFTNPTTFAFADTVFEVQIAGALDRVVAHLPAIAWSWDGSPFHPISQWNDRTGTGSPNFYSDRLPGGAIAPGSTHTVRFWIVFAAGAPDNNYLLFVYIESPGCPRGAVGSSTPIGFGLYTQQRAHHSTSTVTATESPGPSPTTAAQTQDPTIGGSIPPAERVQPLAGDTPSGDGPWTAVAAATAAVLAAFAARMAVGWWSAGRRLP